MREAASSRPISDGRREIDRRSIKDLGAVRDYFESGPAHPVIFEDALDTWPAFAKWSIAHFEADYGDDFGKVRMAFEGKSGRAAKLGDYLANLDRPLAETPGFWVDSDHLPIDAPDGDPDAAWAFHWRAFEAHPELRDDIGAFLPGSGNIVPTLNREVLDLIEWATGNELFSIYISRKGTVTPWHTDFHGTIGSLAQFEGRKEVFMLPPEHGDLATDWDEAQDHEGTLYGTLRPGDHLVIPPGWWHMVRSLDHTFTLSHNFFNQHNASEFLKGLMQDMARKDPKKLCEQMALFAPSGDQD